MDGSPEKSSVVFEIIRFNAGRSNLIILNKSSSFKLTIRFLGIFPLQIHQQIRLVKIGWRKVK